MNFLAKFRLGGTLDWTLALFKGFLELFDISDRCITNSNKKPAVRLFGPSL